MDVPALQEQLVDLSARYGESHRDDQAETAQRRASLQTLREKVAQRQAEQYASPYTKAMAEAEAKMKELGRRYSRETKAYEALVPGTVCPTCHRQITEASLPEVQEELKKAAGAIPCRGQDKTGGTQAASGAGSEKREYLRAIQGRRYSGLER